MPDLRLPRRIVLRMVSAPSVAQFLQRVVVAATLVLIACWIGWTVIAATNEWTARLERGWGFVCGTTWVFLGGLLGVSLFWSLIRKLRKQWLVTNSVRRDQWDFLYVRGEYNGATHVCVVWLGTSLMLLLIHLAFVAGFLPAACARYVRQQEQPILQERVTAFLSRLATPGQAAPNSSVKLDILNDVAPRIAEPVSPRRFLLVDGNGKLEELPRDLQASLADLDSGRASVIQTQARRVQTGGEWFKSGRRVAMAYDEYLEIVVRDYPDAQERARTSVKFANTTGERLSIPALHSHDVVSWLRAQFKNL